MILNLDLSLYHTNPFPYFGRHTTNPMPAYFGTFPFFNRFSLDEEEEDDEENQQTYLIPSNHSSPPPGNSSTSDSTSPGYRIQQSSSTRRGPGGVS